MMIIQLKNDYKDSNVIAGLVGEGQYMKYMIPYLPDGVYADFRTVSYMRFWITN